MPETIWNKDQQKAIDSRNNDGTILVSAAAGSGKTAVLVERVIRKLCDDGVNIEDLLIVTFTRAAAYNMKAKISKALTQKLKENPNNESLRRNLFMLPFANISTIDSFCINLVRENFQKLDIAPDFTILDNAQDCILQQKAINEITQKYHDEKSEEYQKLNDLVNNSKNDNNIIKIIKELYNYSEGYIFPDAWLDKQYEKYIDYTPLIETPAGKETVAKLKKVLQDKLVEIDDIISYLEDAIEKDAPQPDKIARNINLFKEDISIINYILNSLNLADWDDISVEILSHFEKDAAYKFKTNQSVVGDKESEQKVKCLKVRNYGTKSFYTENFPLFFYTEKFHFESINETKDSMSLLIQVVKDYRATLLRLKGEENSYNFSDILHFTLELLATKDKNGNAIKSDLAKELCLKFNEILVDEYQDVSQAQDFIFYALSKDDKNRFLVGDIKQSIYGFRQAMPDVFYNIREDIKNSKSENCITLSSNYRSREGVTNNANFIFEQIMTQKAGGVNYKDNEQLNPAAVFAPRQGEDFEVYLINAENDRMTHQAEFVADYVKKAIDEGMPVFEDDENHHKTVSRPCKASDFCILIRGVKNNTEPFYKAFEKRDIELSVDSENPLFESPEVAFIMSLLRIIDNPLNDIPLVSVLLSPIFGFTPDDLAQMRIENRKGSIYNCLVKSAKSGNEKAQGFLDSIKKYRSIANTLSAGEFTAKIVDEIGYRAIVSAMPNSENRVNNINLFINFASKYETTGVKGISGFVRFVDSLEDSDNISIDNRASSNSDAVKMMTMHKSKGLEFPFVFIVNCQKQFNDMDSRESFIISRDSGLGVNWIKDTVRYKTFSHKVASLSVRAQNRSEEMRLLYVALTRAVEKTIIVATNKDWGKKLDEYDVNCDENSILSKNSHLESMLPALIRHPDAHCLRGKQKSPTPPLDILNAPRARFEIIENFDFENCDDTAVTTAETCDQSNEDLLKEIESRLSYKYPYNPVNATIVKRIASQFEEEEFNENYFASSRPAFAHRGKLTPAQKGTATHRFMQFANYQTASVNPDSEKQKLVQEEKLTQLEADAVDNDAIATFFTTDLAQRILKADKVYKEYGFTASIPLKEVETDIAEDIAQGEVVIIEGVVDCAFEENGKLVIVDYKTDYARSGDELKQKYSPQLEVYRRCLSQALNKEVSETVIYSFRLGEEIKI